MTIADVKKLAKNVRPNPDRPGSSLHDQIMIISRSSNKIYHTDQFDESGPAPGQIWIIEMNFWRPASQFNPINYI